MISSIGSANVRYDPASSLRARSQAVDRFFRKTDSDRDGRITKNELSETLQSDRVEISLSAREAAVDETFQLLDTGDKGYITRQDAAEGLEKARQAPSGDAPAPAGGGGGGGRGGTGAAASEATDPADTNQDGKVSLQEQIAYVLKQYTPADSTRESRLVTYA